MAEPTKEQLRKDYDKLYKSFALQTTKLELEIKQANKTISRITQERNNAHERFKNSTTRNNTQLDKIDDLTQDLRDKKVEAMSYAKIIREQRTDIKVLMRALNKIMDA